MTDKEIEIINQRYEDYCKKHERKAHCLPFVIWLKYVAKIKPSKYYDEEDEGALKWQNERKQSKYRNRLKGEHTHD